MESEPSFGSRDRLVRTEPYVQAGPAVATATKSSVKRSQPQAQLQRARLDPFQFPPALPDAEYHQRGL